MPKDTLNIEAYKLGKGMLEKDLTVLDVGPVEHDGKFYRVNVEVKEHG